MAGVAEKARFHLERSVPQLREFEEKEIFTKDQIRTLVKKRTDFEHTVLAPGCTPAHYTSYIAWEQSLEALRAKRCGRLGVRHSTSHAGQARVFALLERAVQRHPGSGALWRSYLDYAARVGATKRWRKAAARALRLHPTDAGLWALAGRRAARNGDMDGARGYFLRGCRFCTRGPALWVEYARCETEWLGRMESKRGRRELEEAKKAMTVTEEDFIGLGGGEEEEDDAVDEQGMILPEPEGEKAAIDETAVKKLEKSPALDGAIPMAIFDISRKQPFFNAAAAEEFFDMFSGFTNVSAQPRLVQHVLDALTEAHPKNPSTCSCFIRQPLIGMGPHTPEFPKALRESLARLRTSMEETSDKSLLATKTTAWIDPVLAVEGLDPGLKAVLEHTRRKLE